MDRRKMLASTTELSAGQKEIIGVAIGCKPLTADESKLFEEVVKEWHEEFGRDFPHLTLQLRTIDHFQVIFLDGYITQHTFSVIVNRLESKLRGRFPERVLSLMTERIFVEDWY